MDDRPRAQPTYLPTYLDRPHDLSRRHPPDMYVAIRGAPHYFHLVEPDASQAWTWTFEFL